MLKDLIARIDEFVMNIYSYDIGIYNTISELITDINYHYVDFIKLIPKLNEIGMNIDAEGITQQIVHLSDSIKYFDRIEIYDTLKYEIRDTLTFYNEILEIMNS